MSGRGAGADPGDRGPSPWWPAAALVAVAGGAVLADRFTAAGPRQILAWACAAVAVLAVGWSAELTRRLRAERARAARERRTSRARAAEVTRLASVRLPAITELLRAGRRLDSAPGPLAPAADTGDEFARALETVVEALGSDEAVSRERVLRDSVQAAFESVARNMHAMATVQQQVLDRVERTIEDPRLMAEVMKADHAAAQMTRKAQTLLVMCGIWPARRETRPVSLYDCVRGAQSRIVEFNRIEVHGGQTLYVVPAAVEGLMHAIAELLENATVFSPSRTQVVVTVREVGAGAVVEIDDAGLGMPADVLRQSTARIRDELDLAELGAVPRLGLACVGRWTKELGFGVELTGTSAYGGTRAVAFVPYRLLTEPLSHLSGGSRRQAEPAGRGSGPGPGPRGYAYPDGGAGEDPGPGGTGTGGSGGAGPDPRPGARNGVGPGPHHGAYAAEPYAEPHPGARADPYPGGYSGPYNGAYAGPRAAPHTDGYPGARNGSSGSSAGGPSGGSHMGGHPEPYPGAYSTPRADDRPDDRPEPHSAAYEDGVAPHPGGAGEHGVPGPAAPSRPLPDGGRDAPERTGRPERREQPDQRERAGRAEAFDAPPGASLYRDAGVPVSGGRPGTAPAPGAYADGYRGAPPHSGPHSDAPQHTAAHRAAEAAAPSDAPHGAAQHHPAGAPGRADRPVALPRRRSRRGAAVEAAAQTALTPQPPAAPALPADRPAWTPEAARASVASVVSGSRRGRAALADADADADAVSDTGSDTGAAPRPDHTDAHHGGRP
ncbi:ATP-binding protein [Streptomyces sp. NPDC020141]|uniref:ATP-binding protein n=1 Tax=Streptomyces sp. NPDC020141 TaxID=3365065 RepID=UPI0037967626